MSKPGPLVIGLTGGIASGKSAVADELERLGCRVSRSDQQAHAMLKREQVRSALVEWFGPGVLDQEGQISRKGLADVIFNDPEARKRVESLIHPLLHAERKNQLELAAHEGVQAFVIDAPLLMEAGVDAECDVVIFVDSPLEQRLERVTRGRGWDEAEFTRREKAQLGLDAKRARADYVVVNDSDRETLSGRIKQLLSEILSS